MPGGIGAVAYSTIVGQRQDEPGTVVAFSAGSLLNLAQGKFRAHDADDVRRVGSIGLALSTIGIDANSGVMGYTYDMPNLIDGLAFSTPVIGLFAISERLILLQTHHDGDCVSMNKGGRKMFNMSQLKFTFPAALRGSVIGVFIGLLPGAGGTVGSALAYSTERKMAAQSPATNRFGRGDLRGLATVEAENNSACNSDFIPMLTLGVPSSGMTAIMLGVLTLYNLTPRPMLFTSQPELVWELIASRFIGKIMLLAMSIPMVVLFARLLLVPAWVLVPFIVVSAVGVYSGKSASFDLVLMTAIGVIAYWLRRMAVLMAPLIPGFVLGGILEMNLRRVLPLSAGKPQILWSRTIATVLWVGAVAILVVPRVMRRLLPAEARIAED